MGGCGGFQQLLSANPNRTTVLVFLSLGFWLLLGCDNWRDSEH